jgi:hypothetical protein
MQEQPINPAPAPVANNFPTKDDQVLFLFEANRHYLKNLLPYIKRIRAVSSDPQLRKSVDTIDQLNRSLVTAHQQFHRRVLVMTNNDESLKKQTQVIADLATECAMLPLTTAPDKMTALSAMVENFKSGTYIEADPRMVEALQNAPEDFNAQIGIVLHTYLPDVDRPLRESLARALETLFSTRKQIGY